MMTRGGILSIGRTIETAAPDVVAAAAAAAAAAAPPAATAAACTGVLNKNCYG